MPYRKLLLNSLDHLYVGTRSRFRKPNPIPRKRRPDLRKSSLSEAGSRAEA